MSQGNKKRSAFCQHEEVLPHLPPLMRELSLAEVLAKSRAGHWAPYIKIDGQKSPPYFRKSDVLAFAKLKWGLVHPELIQSMLDAGFEPAPECARYPMNARQRRAREAR